MAIRTFGKRFLFVRTDRMGDLLMSLPAVHAFRKEFPNVQVCLLLQKGLAPLLDGHPDLDRILTWDPGQERGWGAVLRWARMLRRERFDGVIVLNPTRLFHIATFLAGVPIRVGYRRKWGFLLNRSMKDTKAERGLHEAQYNFELVQLMGIEPENPLYRLAVPKQAVAQVDELLHSMGVASSCRPVAIHPWTSNPAKGWPSNCFQQVALALVVEGRTVLVIGEPDPRLRDRWWEEAPRGILPLVGKVPLGLLPALMKRCAVLLSNDSGPVHVAAAVGTRTVVVAPEGHAMALRRWRPLGDGHLTLLSASVEEVVRRLLEIAPVCAS